MFSVLLMFAGVQPADGQTPTPEQLQLLNSLPPDQRQQVLQQIQGNQGQATDPQLEFPSTVIQPIPEDQLLNERIIEALGQPPRLSIGSTVVIAFDPRAGRLAQLSVTDRQQQTAFGDRLSANNPYRLNAEGNLNLPGVPAIPLAGLNAEQATVRINAESALVNFTVNVSLLPLDPVGVAALEPFGYDLFEGVPTTFAPATDVPVPAEYVMGPGDNMRVQLFGNENIEYALVVSRDGVVNLPEIGPINVSGLTFVEARDVISQRIDEQMIGVRSSITLGELRSIRIFVLGDVERPGSYTVSGLSTITNALFVSGGIEEIGTLRRIELKRDGETVSTLDLYDLLLRGDTSDDERLLPGDAIFVPPIGDTIVVDGSVRRPAIYELNGETTAAEVIEPRRRIARDRRCDERQDRARRAKPGHLRSRD